MKQIITTTCLGAALVSGIFGETLRDQLQAKEDEGRLPAEVKAEFKKGIEAVKSAKIVEGAKQVGDEAPSFTLKNSKGEEVSLEEELKKGPVVLTWYRGGWCPYCNIALVAMQKELPAIEKAGASLIALTPELPDKSLSTKENNELSFNVLTDLNHRVAEKYGLVFKLTPEVEKLYSGFFDLAEFNGKEAGKDTLPLTATYVIGQDKKIEWAFLHHDYHMRAEPSDIVRFLEDRKSE